HVRYAEFIGTYHRLPGHDDIGNLNLAEGFQAPLYHFLIGTIISSLNFSISDINWIDNLSFDGTSRIGKASILNNKATRDGSSRDSIIAYHILRIPNAVFGALMVWWLWLGLVRSNVREEIALLISGLFASTAEATFMAGVVGNDMLAGAFSALAFIYFVRSEHSISNKDFIIACIILSLGILTKMTVLFLWMGFIIIYSIKKPFR
ncbi:MAG: ArnT family glycosyltransferase, partial [Calditrichota bacterium]